MDDYIPSAPPFFYGNYKSRIDGLPATNCLHGWVMAWKFKPFLHTILGYFMQENFIDRKKTHDLPTLRFTLCTRKLGMKGPEFENH